MKTIKKLVAELRLFADGCPQMIGKDFVPVRKIIKDFAARIDVAAKRAVEAVYNEANATPNIDPTDVGDICRVIEITIGDYINENN